MVCIMIITYNKGGSHITHRNAHAGITLAGIPWQVGMAINIIYRTQLLALVEMGHHKLNYGTLL